MIIDRPLRLRASDLPAPLEAARSLLDEKWLKQQLKKEPSDPLLFHLKTVRSPRLSIHSVRYGMPEGMHPLAEAVKLGEEIVAQHERDGRELASPLLYLLLSLNTLAQQRTRVANFDSRFRRIFRERDWKSTFYELLVAAGYASLGISVQLLPESERPTPDIELGLTLPVYAECKAKLRYESAVIDFIERWRRTALGDISAYLRQVEAGFILRISLHDEAAMPALPRVIKRMVTDGVESRAESAFSIDIAPIHPAPVSLGRDPVSIASADFWRRSLAFDEWRDWHYVLPGGNFRITNWSNALATEMARPTLVCIRSTRLADNEVNVLPSLREACRRQFRSHSPGVLHVLINSSLFGLGTRCSLDHVDQAVTRAAEQLLREYTRVFAVVYDLVKPPEFGDYRTEVRRRIIPEAARWPADYPAPPPILLF
ncbi:MAG: hypothetical protein HY527_01070 [Betaproteobacteria bacterium]|nr:hypothetical protein [Betaproteobacteria bacterium]